MDKAIRINSLVASTLRNSHEIHAEKDQLNQYALAELRSRFLSQVSSLICRARLLSVSACERVLTQFQKLTDDDACLPCSDLRGRENTIGKLENAVVKITLSSEKAAS
jgi:hypothetical protein